MERYADECDVCIVGGGPAGMFWLFFDEPTNFSSIMPSMLMTDVSLAGMSTAIKLKQLANEAGDEVCFSIALLPPLA